MKDKKLTHGGESQLIVENLCLRFGGVSALNDLSFATRVGEIHGIIGPNGAGKTSILNSISGFYKPQVGRIIFEDNEITFLPAHRRPALGISRTFQNIQLFAGMTVLDNLMAARHIYLKHNVIKSAIFFGPNRRMELAHREKIEDIIDLLDLAPLRKKLVGTLPYGHQKIVDLGRALALEPKLLLLDEPMAGMNIEEKEDMARFILDILELKGTGIILVEHDMGVVMDLCKRLIVMDFGKIIAEGTPEEIKVNKDVIEAYLGKKSC